ncbi:MAG: hypothetical protein IH614_00970 [Desulfuromonadales bacterium]|nr:hypothetical protein [Desulfuromonadales bacterium]
MFGQRLWRFCCSLKLAIVLASTGTMVMIGGSLLIPAYPRLFGPMDQLPLLAWWRSLGSQAPSHTWWVPVAGLLLVLLGFNTLCCFIDWLLNLRSRWRKTGEYLVHLGFVLLLIGYLWGSISGLRTEGVRITIGQTIPVPGMSGHYLQLETLEPVLAKGRQIDIIADLRLLRGDTVLTRKVARTNHPLLQRSLVVIPLSFGQQVVGFRTLFPPLGTVHLTPGSRLEIPGGGELRVLAIYPNATRRPGGQVIQRGESAGRPAFLLQLHSSAAVPWQGWYLPSEEPAPPALAVAGVDLRPLEPLYRPFGLFTITLDPGWPLAAAGATSMLAGIVFALVSFYAKRRRGDRPEIY